MKPKIITTPCKRCKKSPRFDFNGYCMDCADELGLTAFSIIMKRFQKGEISPKRFVEMMSNLSKQEPLLVQQGENIFLMSVILQKRKKKKK